MRSLVQHRLANCVTIFTAALAVGLSFTVFAVNAQAKAAFLGGGGGYDAVLGARGSALQLVLNAVFHLETSPGNIPWSLYQTVSESPGVERAVPLAVGDNYRGFRLIGTTRSFFDDPPSDSPAFRLHKNGRYFNPELREAVVGSSVARATGLNVGSEFNPYHGLIYDEEARHQEEYVVVGVLEPTNSPVDKVVFIPIEGIFRMDGHVLRGAGENYVPSVGESIPQEHREVSAVLLDLSNPQVGFSLSQRVNRQGRVATLAFPIGRVVGEVFDKLGWAHRILGLVSILVMFIAASSIVASLIQSLSSRERDFAILRALGMPRRNLIWLLVLESALVSFLGSLGGFVVYGVALLASSTIIRNQTGVVLDIWSFHPVFIWGPMLMTGLSATVGLLPAWRAYSSPVAEKLKG